MTSQTSLKGDISQAVGAILTLILNAFVIRPWLLYWLWNWLAVEKFNAPNLTFWEGFWLLWLISIFLDKTVNQLKQ